ncbi:hypothetical protein FQR65_LT18061 [Abscondita terminalis]|nr:hypothetical protein FQR65_LT18061 [Abscondita terminalis]
MAPKTQKSIDALLLAKGKGLIEEFEYFRDFIDSLTDTEITHTIKKRIRCELDIFIPLARMAPKTQKSIDALLLAKGKGLIEEFEYFRDFIDSLTDTEITHTIKKRIRCELDIFIPLAR